MFESFGFSQSMMESIVIIGILVVVVGIVFIVLWKYIVAGIALMFCFAVLANHKTPEPPKEKVVEVITEMKEVIPETPPVIQVKPEDDKKYFMEDCMSLTDYSKSECEKIWSKREDEDEFVEEPSKNPVLLDVSNVEYKMRRAEALKKRGAIVLHATYH